MQIFIIINNKKSLITTTENPSSKNKIFKIYIQISKRKQAQTIKQKISFPKISNSLSEKSSHAPSILAKTLKSPLYLKVSNPQLSDDPAIIAHGIPEKAARAPRPMEHPLISASAGARKNSPHLFTANNGVAASEAARAQMKISRERRPRFDQRLPGGGRRKCNDGRVKERPEAWVV